MVKESAISRRRVLHEPEIEPDPTAPRPIGDARSRVLRNTGARSIPKHSFGPEPVEGELGRPGWASGSPAKLRSWWPGGRQHHTPAPEPTPEPEPERLYEEEFESQEEPHELLMGAAAHLEQVYEETFAEARQSGYQDGLEQGLNEGREQARQDVEERLSEVGELIQVLRDQMEHLADLRRRALVDAEEQAVELALSFGERLAERALLTDTAWVAPLMREASEALTEADRVVCRVSPELGRRLRQAQAVPEFDGVFEISEDLGPLDLVVESHCGRVDASFSERLRQLRRAVQTRVQEINAAPQLASPPQDELEEQFQTLGSLDVPTLAGEDR